MPKLDLTFTLTSVIALAAIISPIFVTLLNNHYQLKLKSMETLNSQRFSAIEKYLNSAGKYIDRGTVINSNEYESTKGLVYLYVDKSTWTVIDNLDQYIFSGDIDKARKYFPVVCKELSKAIQ